MRDMFLPRSEWVLSGGVQNWGEEIVPLLDLVVFLRTSTEVRVERLRSREARTLAPKRSARAAGVGKEVQEFIDWAAQYDAGTAEGRNLSLQLAWLNSFPTRVLRLDAARPLDDLVAAVLEAWRQQLSAGRA